MRSFVLNGSLTSALGRPELAYQAQQGYAIQAGVAPLVSVVAGANDFDFSSRLPLVLLAGIIVAYVGFAMWVRPHIA